MTEQKKINPDQILADAGGAWNPFRSSNSSLDYLKSLDDNPNRGQSVNIPSFMQSGVVPHADQLSDSPGDSLFNNVFTRGASVLGQGIGALGQGYANIGNAIANKASGWFADKPVATIPSLPNNNLINQNYLNDVNKQRISQTPMNASPLFNNIAQYAPQQNQNFVGNNVSQTRNALSSLGTFTPERNNFALDARGRYDQAFNNLLDSYNQQVNNPDDSFSGLFSQLKTRGGLSKQLGLVANQLNTNNQLASSDINSANQLNLQDLTGQRSNILSLGQLQQQQNANINANDLSVAQLNSNISDTNNTNALRTQEFMAKKPLVDLQNKAISDINKGSDPANYSTDELSKILKSPDYTAIIDRSRKAGIPISQYLPDILNDHASKAIRSNSIALASLNGSMANQKSPVQAELETEGGLKLKGTPDEVISAKERMEKLAKDKKNKVLVDSNGNRL